LDKRIVIVGCGGFVGSHLLDRLLSRNDISITGWDPDSDKILDHIDNRRLLFYKESCNGPSVLRSLERHVMDCDVVINLAAICNPSEYNTRPLDVIRANLFDVYPIVDICAKHNKWIIHFSTSEIYGRTISSYLKSEVYTDSDLYELREYETPLVMGPIGNQRWTYACAKQMMERYIFAHHSNSGLPYTIIRPLNFFGPKMDYIPRVDGEGVPRVLACFMAALLDRKPMQLVDGGSARRTIVAVEEAVEAIERMLDLPDAAKNRIFNIGNPSNEVTIRQLADAMRRTYAEITGDPSYNDHPMISVSAVEFYGKGYEDCDRRMPDISQAMSELGWTPQRSLSEILRTTMADYHARYASARKSSTLKF